MNELSRLLNLVPFISTHQGISIASLASEFGVTEKEIVSDLTTLFMCGLPGYTPLELMEVDFEDGYVSIRNAETLRSPRALTQDEVFLLMIALSQLAELQPENDRISALYERLRNLIKVPVHIVPNPTLTVQKKIQQAIKSDKQITFTYFAKYRDSTSIRTVSPQEFIQSDGRTYLRAFCHSALAMRTFILEEISGVSILESKREVSTGDEGSLEFTIKILNRYKKFIGIFKNEKSKTFSSLWAVRALISAAGDVRVENPPWLRAEVAEKARLALAEYKALG